MSRANHRCDRYARALTPRSSGPRALLLATAGLAVSACGSDFSREDVATRSDAIINGTADNGINSVELPGCSAVALDETWVLTARHCVRNPTTGVDLVTPGTDQATRVSPNEARTIRAVMRHGTEDIALVQVDAFSQLDQRLPLWDRPMGDLLESVLYCFGRGGNTTPSAGFGTWRSASLNVNETFADGYRLRPNTQGQIQWRGDSGGPCLLVGLFWPPLVTGIQSTVRYNCSAQATPQQCNDSPDTYATQVTSAYQVGLSPGISNWIRGNGWAAWAMPVCTLSSLVGRVDIACEPHRLPPAGGGSFQTPWLSVQRMDSGGGWVDVGPASDSPSPLGVTYTYRIRYFNNFGAGPWAFYQATPREYPSCESICTGSCGSIPRGDGTFCTCAVCPACPTCSSGTHCEYAPDYSSASCVIDDFACPRCLPPRHLEIDPDLGCICR